jgi:DNA-binding PadR family transcriptional regulator
VRLALLALLEDGPKHGYELMKALEDRTGGFYRASAGTVYPTLQQLEDEGLVVSEPHDGKRVYRLTDAGRRELGREAEAVRRIFHRVDSHHEWRAWGEPEMGPVLGAFGDLVGSIWRTVRAGQGRPETLVRIREILVNARREVDGLASPGVDTGGDGERREQPG